MTGIFKNLNNLFYTLLGVVLGTLLVIKTFPFLFANGRIWAEEGAMFMASMLTKGNNQLSTDNFLYLHNGQWHLWTNIAAYIAKMSILNSPLVFTYMALMPHILTALGMSRFALSNVSTERAKSPVVYFIVGILAILINIVIGGPEVFVNTTNSQWILCVYVFFATCNNIEDRVIQSSNFIKALKFVIDFGAILSSFAGSVLFPIQITCFAIFNSSNRNPLKIFSTASNLLSKNIGFLVGFSIQLLTVIALSSDSSKDRPIEFYEAIKGFLFQGVTALLIPPGGALEGLINFAKSDSILFVIYSIFFGILLLYPLTFAGNNFSLKNIIVLYLITFVFCQFALGYKANLTSAGWGMRYFAPLRIGLTWLAVSEAIEIIILKNRRWIPKLLIPTSFAIALTISSINTIQIVHWNFSEF